MSNKILIFHNPQCSKSREALEILNQNNCDIEVVEYLKKTPSKEELENIIKLLGIKPFDLVRQNEEIFKTTFKDKKLSDKKWIEAMVNYPKLIERPIVINNGKAVIGRPPSLVLDIISQSH